jgi:hypothetical protein
MKAGLKCNCDMRVCRFVRSTLVALALSFGLDSYAWAATTVLHEDFEDDALGPLGPPWTISSSGTGSVRIVSTTDPNHGSHVLRLNGSNTEGHFLIASLPISSSAADITTEIDIKADPNASFIWILNGAGSSIGRRRIRLQQEPGSTTLVSNTVPGGNRSCGELPVGTWTRITLMVHTVPRTFSVLIGGEATACTDLSTGFQPPFNSVSVMDASNAGWGGTVRFDNIDVTTPSD